MIFTVEVSPQNLLLIRSFHSIYIFLLVTAPHGIPVYIHYTTPTGGMQCPGDPRWRARPDLGTIAWGGEVGE